MQLTHLSFQHVPPRHSPISPTNDERVRSWRNLLPVVHANSHRWDFKKSEQPHEAEEKGK